MFKESLTGLSSKHVQVVGHETLETTNGEGEDAKAIDVNYFIMETFSPYNIILRKPSINALEAVVSTLHLVLKYPLHIGRVSINQGDQKIFQECYQNSMATKREKLAIIDYPLLKFQILTLSVRALS